MITSLTAKDVHLIALVKNLSFHFPQIFLVVKNSFSLRYSFLFLFTNLRVVECFLV